MSNFRHKAHVQKPFVSALGQAKLPETHSPVASNTAKVSTVWFAVLDRYYRNEGFWEVWPAVAH